MKIKPLREKACFVDVYKTDVILLVGEWSLVRKWASKNVKDDKKTELLETIDAIDHVGNRCYGRTIFVGKGGGCLIWIEKWKPTVFVHEIAHAAHHIFESKSIPFSSDTDEPYAYMIECLYERLFLHGNRV